MAHSSPSQAPFDGLGEASAADAVGGKAQAPDPDAPLHALLVDSVAQAIHSWLDGADAANWRCVCRATRRSATLPSVQKVRSGGSGRGAWDKGFKIRDPPGVCLAGLAGGVLPHWFTCAAGPNTRKLYWRARRECIRGDGLIRGVPKLH